MVLPSRCYLCRRFAPSVGHLLPCVLGPLVGPISEGRWQEAWGRALARIVGYNSLQRVVVALEGLLWDQVGCTPFIELASCCGQLSEFGFFVLH